MYDLNDTISALMRSVASAVVMPRFRNLIESEVAEKSPGEVVTIADREAEEQLSAGLERLGIGARIVGEEACALDPERMNGLGEGLLWIIDPIDGTANFAAGRQPFGLMIALVADGIGEAAWLYDPVNDRMCHAIRGKGAFIDGARVQTRSPARQRPIAALATQFMPPEMRDKVRLHAERSFDLVPIPHCAAEHYPRLCLGQNDIALFQRTLPWDHAAGVLFLTEAGGCARRWDGATYRLGDGKTGLLATTTDALWEHAAAALFCEGSGLSGEA